MAGTTTVLVTFTKAYMRRLESKDRQRQELVADERLGRLEQAVDAIAVEVERISEGQRFVTKLLTERTAEPPLLPGGEQTRR